MPQRSLPITDFPILIALIDFVGDLKRCNAQHDLTQHRDKTSQAKQRQSGTCIGSQFGVTRLGILDAGRDGQNLGVIKNLVDTLAPQVAEQRQFNNQVSTIEAERCASLGFLFAPLKLGTE